MAIDPVCGMQVNEDEAAEHSLYDSKEYYFCTIACQQKFEHAPGDFLHLAA